VFAGVVSSRPRADRTGSRSCNLRAQSPPIVVELIEPADDSSENGGGQSGCFERGCDSPAPD
jgi:hypothetical protein